MSIFEIESDIRIAETLSADFYTNPSYFESSKSKIFARSWQPAALEQLTSAIEPVTLLDGFLDEPLVITRTADRVHCLSNVCTHRGMIVAEDCRSAANGLRCRYHGRRFGLDGTFLSMPEFDDALNFPSNADNLRLFESEAWSGLRFVALDPAAPFGEFFGPAVEISSRLYSAPLKFAGNRDYDVNAHWALYCENYLEGFHVPFVHPELNRAIDFESYETQTFRYSSLQTAKSGDDCFDNSVAAYYFFVFPNMMFNFYPWGLSVNVVKPLTPGRTKVTYLTFIADETRRGSGAGGNLDAVELEDQGVVEAVQKGIRSRFYDRGRYSPKQERGTHHFHQLIAEFMTK